jgi:ATP-dependent DNA helicase RecQ
MLRRRLGEDRTYFYHAGLTKEEKADVEQWFFDSDDGVLVATCAYGMGVDKKNIRSVIHKDLSPSVEAYLQESGRAGRDRKRAEAVLLISSEDLPRAEDEARTEHITSGGPGGIEKERYRALLACVRDSSRCRRESLLELLDTQPEACFGCDVCDGDVVYSPGGRREIMDLVVNNKRRFSMSESVQLLAGRRTVDVERKKLWANRFYGTLCGWDHDEIETAIFALMSEGSIRYACKYFWGETLTCR